MNPARLTAIAAALSAAVWISLEDQAEASEWGCEVLLCASSSNPSWRGVAACHPPMNRLISAMGKWGFSWPTCPEAGTGRPGYEAYDECPAGWSVGSSNQEHGGSQDDLCVQVRNSCPSGFGGRDGCQQNVTKPRPMRDDPYYFDIRSDDGNVTRHWFNLNR
ncbi:hypothetical protein ACFFTN_13405 [Aminobacter aganoensis]|uniref:Uncharacterized protein n=1 Tax=Aminobacter aganoensis TaxID=83264 RepID=A0A7X0FA39_9HYPH|nr:hypothetical protein [Aminobacter aganoensis]MBB6355688.1 hypothetical protein [Aminobacter aganoensis]